MRFGHGWTEWFPPSSAVCQWEGNTEIGFGACLGDVCLFLLEARASDLKAFKINLTVPTRKRPATPCSSCSLAPHRCGMDRRFFFFCQTSNSQEEWLILKHGAFEIDRKELGMSSKDQTSHNETWIHASRPNATDQDSEGSSATAQVA